MQITKDSLRSAYIAVPVSPYDGDQVVAFAASELQRYLEKMTGIRLPISDDTDRSDRKAFVRFVLEAEHEAASDAFRVKVASGEIVLTAAVPRGLLYGAYGLLERLGCRWVHPFQEIVPPADSLNLPDGEYTETPHIEHRGLALYGLYGETVELGRALIDWMAKNRLNLLLTSWDRPDPTNTQTMFWREVADELLPELKRRGILLEMSEHSTHVFMPRSLFNDHPDWFALTNGERRPGQMCYSNPDAVEHYGRELAKFAAEHPEIDILGAWPLDGGGYCECEGCADSDTVFKATARIAEIVHEVRPDIIMEYLAYQPQTLSVPDAEIPEYMSVLLCDRMHELARNWVAATEGKQGTYYFEYKMADQYHWATNVWLRPHYARNMTRLAVDIGFRGIIPLFLPMHTWWQSSFNVHFYARTCWDPELNVDKHLADYCAAYFGEAADAVEAVFKRIFHRLHRPEFIDDRRLFGGLDPLRSNKWSVARAREDGERLLAQLALLEEAVSDPSVRDRLKHVRVYIEYFLLFHDFRAAESTPARQAAIDALGEYAAQHGDVSIGVCTSPEFIRWRLRP